MVCCLSIQFFSNVKTWVLVVLIFNPTSWTICCSWRPVIGREGLVCRWGFTDSLLRQDGVVSRSLFPVEGLCDVRINLAIFLCAVRVSQQCVMFENFVLSFKVKRCSLIWELRRSLSLYELIIDRERVLEVLDLLLVGLLSSLWSLWSWFVLYFDWAWSESLWGWSGGRSYLHCAEHLVPALFSFHNFVCLVLLLHGSRERAVCYRRLTPYFSRYLMWWTWYRELFKFGILPGMSRTCHYRMAFVLLLRIIFLLFVMLWLISIIGNAFSYMVQKVFFILLQSCRYRWIMSLVQGSYLSLQLFYRRPVFLDPLMLQMELLVDDFSNLFWCPFNIKRILLSHAILQYFQDQAVRLWFLGITMSVNVNYLMRFHRMNCIGILLIVFCVLQLSQIKLIAPDLFIVLVFADDV